MSARLPEAAEARTSASGTSNSASPHRRQASAAQVFTDFPAIRTEISGHTDSTGSVAHNRDLSRRRADSVKRYLAEHGIDPARIETRGAGPDEPVDSNRTPAGRARNPRIEFNLIVGQKP